MSDEFHKPVNYSGAALESVRGGTDPAHIASVARDTAHAIVRRARTHPDPGVVERLVAYVDENGIDAIAELWSHSHSHTLPGALWRIYLVRMVIRDAPDEASFSTSAALTRSPRLIRSLPVPRHRRVRPRSSRLPTKSCAARSRAILASLSSGPPRIVA